MAGRVCVHKEGLFLRNYHHGPKSVNAPKHVSDKGKPDHWNCRSSVRGAKPSANERTRKFVVWIRPSVTFEDMGKTARCEATHNAEATSEAVRVSSWSNWVPSDAQMNLFVTHSKHVNVKCSAVRLKSVISSGSIVKCDGAYRSNWSHYASSWPSSCETPRSSHNLL